MEDYSTSTAIQEEVRVDIADDGRVITGFESNEPKRPVNAFFKRCFDVLVAGTALVALSPLLLVVAVLVKFTSKGPILFRQIRTGLNGRTFEIYKFRSMRPHEDGEVRQATRNDSRVTAIGRVIRRTSIDELPQLVNILFGEMSLVGPRPHALEHDIYYGDAIPKYKMRFAVKPGLTGLAQIKGYRGETDTLEKMRARVGYDLVYVRKNNFFSDIAIVLKTPFSLLSKNAY